MLEWANAKGVSGRKKLEAVDRRDPCLVCVATITDVVEDHVQECFDNWDDDFDYW